MSEQIYGKEHGLKNMKQYVPKEKWKDFVCEIEQMIKNQEEESFMAGYCYAIQILQDSLRKKVK